MSRHSNEQSFICFYLNGLRPILKGECVVGKGKAGHASDKQQVLQSLHVSEDDLQDSRAVVKVATAMPDDDVSIDLGEAFKVFGDSTRVKILLALSYNELCVNDIAALLRMSQSAISHQLKVLRSAHLVAPRKEGKVVFYKLDDQHVESILAIGMQHVIEKRL